MEDIASNYNSNNDNNDSNNKGLSIFSIIIGIFKRQITLSTMLEYIKGFTILDIALLFLYFIVFFQISCYLYRVIYSFVIMLKEKKQEHLKEKSQIIEKLD